MDILTHAFSVILLGGRLDILLVCFGITGTVLPDMDILMQRFSRTDPRLYIFSHGGITHSITGSLLLSLAAFASICLLQLTGILSLPADPLFRIAGLGMIAGGALLHITLDYLACPGIPLFFPFSEKKYTLGVFPGPSLFLTVASVVLIVMLIAGFPPSDGLYVYGIVFSGYLAFSFVKKGMIAVRFRGRRTIPTFNPLHWIIVSEDEREYRIGRYSAAGGMYDESIYKKSDGVGEDEIEALANDPAVKRLKYFSYMVVYERENENIRIYDPLRRSGMIFYPASDREYVTGSP